MDDPLLGWRAKFPALEDCVHFISHSLGCVPAQAGEDLAQFFDQWRTKSITAWEDWLPEVDRAGARIAKIIGAPAGSVVMNQNVSTIMSVVASCFDYEPSRNKIVYEALQFPTVSYVWQAEQRRGAECVLVPSADGKTIDTEAMLDAIDERTLLVPMSHVVFSSAYIQDAKRIAQKARQVGAHVVLDCYQSAGIVPLDVVDLGVSFACGGSVKYLCGGPGAAWLYVRPNLVEQFAPRVTGWFGNEAPFAFTMPEQTYADTTWRFMGGTPAVAGLYQARAGHTIVGEIGVRAIRDKSLWLTTKIIEHVDELGFTLNTPRAPEQRGGSVVFDFVGAADVCRELNRRKFFCDHRPGVGIRIAPHFYTKEEEVGLFFGELKKNPRMIDMLRRRRLLKQASEALEERDGDAAEAAFAKLATIGELSPGQWFDWGLAAKFRGDWAACAKRNLRALELGDGSQPVLWNLGIAAEALRDAALVRKAWSAIGMEEDGTAEGMPKFTDLGNAPVRLESQEVVWCQRLSPARACILNIPLPDSDRRFADVVVHDGEPRGERVAGGRVYSVFDELLLSVPSRLGTYRATVIAPTEQDAAALEELVGEDREFTLEDWTQSVAILCKACSEGRVDKDAPHDHGPSGDYRAERDVGIAAPSESVAAERLERWAAGRTGRRVESLELALEPGR